MMKRSFSAFVGAVVCILVVCLLGCGGGSQTNLLTPTGSIVNGTAGTGRAVFTIKWPDRSRLIPLASNSIKIEVKNGATSVSITLVPRPTNSGSSTVSLPSLPVATLMVIATAYPQANGSGTAQATAAIPLVIHANQTTNFSLTMNSTVAFLELTAPNTYVSVGRTLQTTVTAKDGADAIVMLSPTKLRWISSNTAVATVDASGLVTGVSNGIVDITALDTESGKSGSVPVEVAPANIIMNPANGHYYAAVDTPTLISWNEAKSAAQALRFNGFAGHLVTLTSAAENNFVAAHFPGNSVTSYFTGGFQDHSASNYSEPAGGWKWITGEPWSYTNWHAGEPNDSGSLADYLNLFPDSTWNDAINNDGHGFGYIVEFEP